MGDVVWSRNGTVLFASGWSGVVAWSGGGVGARRVLPGEWDTPWTLVPLPNEDVLVGDATPILARLAQDGKTRWVRKAPIAYFRNNMALSVSADGEIVDFNFDDRAEHQARFDLKTHFFSVLTRLQIQKWSPRAKRDYQFKIGGVHTILRSTAQDCRWSRVRSRAVSRSIRRVIALS